MRKKRHQAYDTFAQMDIEEKLLRREAEKLASAEVRI